MPTCGATTSKTGEPCENPVPIEGICCHVHLEQAPELKDRPKQAVVPVWEPRWEEV